VLLATGVYWLRQVPVGPLARGGDPVVHVRLMAPPPTPQEERQQSLIQPSRPVVVPQPEPLVDDPNRTIPQSVPEPPATKQEQASPPLKRLVPGATASAPARARDSNVALLFQKALLSHIARYQHYPAEAERKGIRGTVRLAFAMRRDGSVDDIRIKM